MESMTAMENNLDSNNGHRINDTDPGVPYRLPTMTIQQWS